MHKVCVLGGGGVARGCACEFKASLVCTVRPNLKRKKGRKEGGIGEEREKSGKRQLEKALLMAI